MRHYEIVLLVHPDQSEQVPPMIERYRKLIEDQGGSIHRLENWGRRPLSYPIKKVRKAHYLLMNLECELSTLRELENSFRFNDAIIRNLILQKDRAIKEPSSLARETERSEEHSSYAARKPKTIKEPEKSPASPESPEEMEEK